MMNYSVYLCEINSKVMQFKIMIFIQKLALILHKYIPGRFFSKSTGGGGGG